MSSLALSPVVHVSSISSAVSWQLATVLDVKVFVGSVESLPDFDNLIVATVQGDEGEWAGLLEALAYHFHI